MSVTLTPEERKLLAKAESRFSTSESYLKPYRDKCDDLYGLFRSYQAFRDGYVSAPPSDKDTVLRDAKRKWGAELFIPFSFSTVETIVPRVVSNRPRGLVLPQARQAESNVENMKFLVERQQEQAGYELVLEETAKSACIYGLGVEKMRWDKRVANRPGLVEKLVIDPQTGTMQPRYVPSDAQKVTLFDDWIVEDIDLADFFWDPFGYTIPTCSYLIHRTWRTSEYCMEQIKSGAWNTQAAQALTTEDLRGGSGSHYEDAFAARLRAAGFSNTRGKGEINEVWEIHERDAQTVVTIVNRAIPVQYAPFPYWHGEYCFHAVRPTTAGIKQLAGIGVIEPIRDLQREINTLRSQRRDNAALKLMQTFAFDDGAIDQNDLKFGPGIGIPVRGSPRDFLMPINVGDIPSSGYQEENNLIEDIQRTTGISDAVQGIDAGAAQTATGIQLVQAAANVRISRISTRVGKELVVPEMRQAILLNQQKIVSEREIRLPLPPQPGHNGPVWEWRQLGPAELAGLMTYDIEDGSLSPENIPQMRSDATTMWNMLRDNPNIDQRSLLRAVLTNLGIDQAESWINPSQAVPVVVLQMLEKAGVDRRLIEKAMAMAQQDNPAATQGDQGPSPEGQNG